MLPSPSFVPAFPNSTFGVGMNSQSVAVGDLTGDGKPDLVVANYISNSLSILVNTTAPGGAPSFGPR